MNQFLAEPVRGDIRPSVLIEKDEVHTQGLDLRNGFPQLLSRSQPRIGVVRGVTAILAAIVPSHELNRLHPVLGAVAANPRQVLIAQAQIIFRRIDIELLPGMYLLYPGGRRRPLEPRTS